MDNKKIRNTVILSICGVLYMAIQFLLFTSPEIIQEYLYNKSISYIEQGEYQKADECLRKLNGDLSSFRDYAETFNKKYSEGHEFYKNSPELYAYTVTIEIWTQKLQ